MNQHRKTQLPACPEGRLSHPTCKNAQGRQVIDTNTYIPYFLAAVNNALSRGASARYLGDFGVGVTEWRVLSMLAAEPGIPAARICDVIALDKSAVSRAIVKLDEMGILDVDVSATDPRRKSLSLNAEGNALHDRILATALEREAKLIQGVDPDDLEAFLRVMRQLRKNVRTL
ncbi:MarR family winged helix-turn-helix transcriptional regulator [Arenibacterium sp. CAU 1754]